MAKSAKSTVTVNRQFTKFGKLVGESGEHETIEIRKFETQPAEVGVEVGLQINLGNYNLAKLTVTCKVPCYLEEADPAYEYAYHFAEDKLNTEAELIKQNQQNYFNDDASPV